MKYLIMLIGDESAYVAMTEEEMSATMQQHNDFVQWCEANNVDVLGGEALVDSPAATTIRSNGVVTDGPYFELKEQVGGYYLIETDSPELAKQAAHKCPNYGANELRPVANMSGM